MNESMDKEMQDKVAAIVLGILARGRLNQQEIEGKLNVRDMGINYRKEQFVKELVALFHDKLAEKEDIIRKEERMRLKELWDALGIRFGASAGSAISATVHNGFGETWDFQLDRYAVNALLSHFSGKIATQSKQSKEQ